MYNTILQITSVYIAYYFCINLPYPSTLLPLVSHVFSSTNHLDPSLSAPSLHLLTIPQLVRAVPISLPFSPVGALYPRQCPWAVGQPSWAVGRASLLMLGHLTCAPVAPLWWWLLSSVDQDIVLSQCRLGQWGSPHNHSFVVLQGCGNKPFCSP